MSLNYHQATDRQLEVILANPYASAEQRQAAKEEQDKRKREAEEELYRKSVWVY